LNNVLNSLMTESTDIAFDLVNEIVISSFQSIQKPMAHSNSCVNKKMFEEWTERSLWVIVNNIKKHTTFSCKIYQEQADTLKF